MSTSISNGCLQKVTEIMALSFNSILKGGYYVLMNVEGKVIYSTPIPEPESPEQMVPIKMICIKRGSFDLYFDFMYNGPKSIKPMYGGVAQSDKKVVMYLPLSTDMVSPEDKVIIRLGVSATTLFDP